MQQINILAYPGLCEFNKSLFMIAKAHSDLDKAELIIKMAAEHFNVSLKEIKSASRKRELVWARMVVINEIKYSTILTLKAIGQLFGRDHSTVIHSLEQYNVLVKYDKEFKKVAARFNGIISNQLEKEVNNQAA